MIEAIASKDSKLIAKRIDDTSSIAVASQRRSVFSSIPAVLVVMILRNKKGAAEATP